MQTIIEPDLKYCPRCMDEYRADIVQCAACKVELISGEQLLRMEEERKGGRGPVELSPDEELVPVRRGPLRDMKHLRSLLAAEGLAALVVADGQSCGKGCCGTEVLLSVRPVDVPDVMKILQREFVRTTGLADHDTSFATAVFNTGVEEAVCPACGHVFATNTTTCPDCGLCFG